LTAQISDEGPKLSDSDVAALEDALGARLPSDFREFLLAHNGGLPDLSTIDVDGLSGSPTDLQVFFGIGRPTKSSDLRWNWVTFRGRVDHELLPIGCDSGGNLFALALRGDRRGRIFYVDVERVADVYPVAANIRDLLGRLRD
jgi:hypothetical protein